MVPSAYVNKNIHNVNVDDERLGCLMQMICRYKKKMVDFPLPHLAEFEFPAKLDLAISHVRGLPMAQGWVSRLVGSLKDIPASKSAATRCPLGSYGLSKSEQKVRVI